MKSFTKKDLKTGMLIECANGTLGIIMLGTTNGDVIASDGLRQGRRFGVLKNYDNDLCRTNRNFYEKDIIKVYDMDNPINNMDRASFDFTHRKLIWERKEEIIEYTMEELENKLGHKFEIKTNKNLK